MHKIDPVVDGRGSRATSPRRIPLKGWKDIILRVQRQLGADNIGIVSAGVSFYALLAIFPAFSAVIALYGILFNRGDVQVHLAIFFELLPEEARNLMQQQLLDITATTEYTLSLGVAIALMFALWSANKGVRAMISALNIVYKQKESRGFIRINIVSLGITAAAVSFMVIAAICVMVIPGILGYIDDFGELEFLVTFLAYLRWPLIGLIMVAGLSAMYRFAPSRQNARWQWLSVGSVFATFLWIIGSLLFSTYVANFGNYNETYGSLGAVIILLMWFYVSTWIVLLGAEINAEVEHQTTIDTTTGPAKPLGQRGATMADTVGRRFE